MPKFTVVIATIRESLPGFSETIARIQSSFDHETDFRLLDGHSGKAQALNDAFDHVLAKTDADIYVTMDDDIVPAKGWQQLVCKAMGALPEYGAFGLWMGDAPDRRELVGERFLDAPETASGVTFRRVQSPHHLNGGFIAYRPEVARGVGKIPTEGLKYQLWEDAWRGRRVTKLGWEMAFLSGVDVDMVEYEDSLEYREMKERDLRVGKKRSDEILAASGLGDPIAIRARKWLARVRGKAR